MSERSPVLIWLPAIVYVLVAGICLLSAVVGVDPAIALLILAPLGSFTVFFYAFYLAFWKARWSRLQRMIIAALLTPAPVVPLAILDVAGVELVHGDPHALMFNVTLWLVPGELMANPVLRAADRIKR